MRFIHAADLHAGSAQYGLRQREQDYLTAAQAVYRAAQAVEAQVVVLAGDIFDTVKPSGRTVEAIQRMVMEARRDYKIETLGIVGNHDPDPSWLDICGIRNLDARYEVIDGIRFGGIQYRRPASFMAELKQRAEDGYKVEVLAVHQAFQEMCGFGGVELALADAVPLLQRIGVRYLAMGDIHLPAEQCMGGIYCRYPGSTEMTDLSEPEEHGCCRVDITADSVERQVLVVPTRPILHHYVDKEPMSQTPANEALIKRALNVVHFSRDHRDYADRTDAVLQRLEALYIHRPIDGTGELMQRKTYDRKGVLLRQQEAVEAFFQPGTDAYQLVMQLLANPEQQDGIVDRYLAEKGIA